MWQLSLPLNVAEEYEPKRKEGMRFDPESLDVKVSRDVGELED